MRVYVALCVLAAMVYIFLLATLWSQNRRTPANKFLRFFIAGLLCWLCLELFTFTDMSQGRELLQQRLVSWFWVTSTMLFLHFVYVFLERPRDALLWVITALVLFAAALFSLTDLGMAAAVRENWGVRGVPGVGFWPIVIIAAVPGPLALGILWRAFQRPEGEALRPAIRLVVVGGAVALGLALLVNAVLPVLLGIHTVPQVATSAGAVHCLFVTVAIVRHDFMAISVEQAARALFERLPEGVVLVDREGEIRSINRRALELLGLPGAPRHAWQLPGLGQGLVVGVRPVAVDIQEEESQLLMSVSEHALRDQLLGYIVSYRDVSEEGRIERRISQEAAALEVEVERRSRAIEQTRSRETLGAFAGSIIHDFNNHLFPIISLSELAVEQFEPEDPRAQDMRSVLFAATKAADVGRKLLAFTRTQTAKRSLVDLVKVVEDVGHFLRSSVPGGVRVEVLVEAAEAFVVGMPGALRQMLVNVAVNAVDALPSKGGNITIALRRLLPSERGDRGRGKALPGPLAIEVRDTGVGLPPRAQEEIFRPFFTTKADQGRAGLGLSVAQHIAGEHGGFIDVSPGPDCGTVAAIRLPGLLRSSWVEMVAQQPELVGDERVLVAASSAETEEELEAALRPLGYQVFVMADALKAARVLRADPTHYDLLLIDGSDPSEIAELVATVHRHRTNLCVLVLGATEADLEPHHLTHVSYESLPRPFQRGALAAAVRRALGQQQSR